MTRKDEHDSTHRVQADHDDGPDHAHDYDHQHRHEHPHDHRHSPSLFGWIGSLFHLHGHSNQQQDLLADTALATDDGIRTIWLALVALGMTTAVQVGIVLLSGSVALLADTIHNFVDALNSIPLLIAFYLARRAATRRYTYGYGRAEDVAGIVIVLSIVVSAGVVFYESFLKLLDPQPMRHLGWVAAAALVGFLGNEAVAMLQIRAGKRIGSAAMIADGQHARTDGLTSLAVLLAAGGTWLGYPIVDPLIGFGIGIAILFITWDAVRAMWYRLMDAVEPEIVHGIERVAAAVSGVENVHDVRVRWLGHRLEAELHIVVNEDLPTRESHRIAEEVRHALFHAQSRLAAINIHVDPCGHSGVDPHAATVHHQRQVADRQSPGYT